MKQVLKSIAFGVVGAGLFSFFLMMALIPMLAVIARRSGNISQSSVVVEPGSIMYMYGLPLAVVVFAVCFVLGMRRQRRPSPHPR